MLEKGPPNNPSEGPQTGFLTFFGCQGVEVGTKNRSKIDPKWKRRWEASWDRFFDDFWSILGVLGSGSGLKMLLGPVRSFSRSRFLISSILDPFRVNFGILGRPQYCVFLQDRDCSSSATRKFSPNPSYLRSGELVLPWDTKNRSSHTQIVHIDILRAQMYLKSAIWAHGPSGPTGPGPMGPWILHF